MLPPNSSLSNGIIPQENSLFYTKKTKLPMEPCIHDSIGRWFEWGDSNSRHLDPKGLLEASSNPFESV